MSVVIFREAFKKIKARKIIELENNRVLLEEYRDNYEQALVRLKEHYASRIFFRDRERHYAKDLKALKQHHFLRAAKVMVDIKMIELKYKERD